MASPAPDTNGISTPPATASAAHTNSPPASASASQPQSAAQQPTLSTSASANANTSTAYPPTSLLDTGTTKRPRDARLIHLLLANMGVSAYTERVPLQLLDFAYRYTSGVLTDALSYEPPVPSSLPAGEKKKRDNTGGAEEGVSLNALRTSVAGRAASSMGGSAALSKEFLAEMASERNRVALPRVEREFGFRLPPERYCFTGVGWGVKEAWEGEEEEGSESGDEEMGDGGPVGGEGFGGAVVAKEDTEMGGMGDEEDEVDEDEFQAVMG
ncbi:hypothetical protein B5807_01977 [Epicoccum nigrum]|uniref:TFIID-31kDa-domain-containing protein n=1 Tax=Epicoccum nigrum TaxID=105696 RepID=A0A1Y2MC84_EPING|nr:hypothetical protein B5807_01977 [Epicoccum nigrum]